MIETLAGLGSHNTVSPAEVTAVKDFLKSAFGTMDIGANANLVEMSIFDTGIHSTTTFDDNRDKVHLMHSIDNLHFRQRQLSVDLRTLLSFLATQAFDDTSGDRPGVPNDIVIILEHSARPTADVNGLERIMLSRISGRIIFINIGQPSASAIQVGKPPQPWVCLI